MKIDDTPASVQEIAATTRHSILVIDPRALTRGCVAHVLRTEFPEYALVEATSFSDDPSPAAGTPRLIVLALDHEEPLDTEVARRIAFLRTAFPEAPIALMCEDDDHSLAAAIHHGCSGYLPTSLPLAVAVAALRLVMVGGSYFPQLPQMDRKGSRTAENLQGQHVAMPAMAEIILPASFPDRHSSVDPSVSSASHPAPVGRGFTPRELEVIAALQCGLSNKIIAADLGMSENTVKVHVRHVMRKLRATNRTQAALMSRARFEGASA